MVVRDLTGLHARPASALSEAAKRFASSIRARHGPREADVKRLISLLALGVKRGGEIRVSIEGPDEEEACRELETLVANGWDRDPGEELLPSSALHPRPAASSSSRLLRGVPAAAGVAVGRTHRPLSPPTLAEETTPDPERERRRLAEALEAARGQIAALSADARRRAGSREAAIFELRLGFLDDPEILGAVHAGIDSGRSAAAACKTTWEREASTLDGLADPLLASRAADVRDTGDQVLRLLLETTQTACSPETPVILVTDELNPSDFARVERAGLLGIAAARGTATSHGAILARAFGVPAVTGLGEALADLPTGVEVVLDGDAGTLLVEPRPAEVEGARERLRSVRVFTKVQRGLGPTATSDGHLVEVLANVGGPAEVLAALDQGAAGVGLLRTEFLFASSPQPPTEEEQLAVYREMAVALRGRPLTVRTLDAGGDKPLPYLPVPSAGTPSLGLRGLRLSLMRPEILRTQLRAILRARDSGPVKVMFPMVSTLDEWRSARTLLEEARAECGLPAIEAGIMVEVPSCALLAEAFAPEVDFFSIGTNDLTQYTLAADRNEASLRAVADGLHPAVLRLVHQTVSSGHAAGKPVTVCGELAADAQAVPILVGIGVDALSVSPSAIPAVASQLRQLTLPSARQLAERALACKTAADVRKLVASG